MQLPQSGSLHDGRAIVDGGIRAWGSQAGTSADARQNVELLSSRFSNLFSQLAREEAALKAAQSNNESLEQQLQDFRRQDPRGKLSQAGSYFDGEVAELRAEAQAAEHRAALQGGEAGALAAAQATYHRQCARLQERCQAEAAQERSAMETFRQSASELAHLKSDCSQLTAQLDAAEAQRHSLHRDLQLAKEGEKQMSEKTIELRQKLADGKAKVQKERDQGQLRREEVSACEKRLSSLKDNTQELRRSLGEERDSAQKTETRLREQVGRKTRYEQELSSLRDQLDKLRKEGMELQEQNQEKVKEVKQLQERLLCEQEKHRSELQAAETCRAHTKRLEAELTGAEGAKADVELELANLRKLAADLTEQCAEQRRSRDEHLQKQSAGEVTVERLRLELRELNADRTRLQREADQATQERNRLEVELQVAAPALDEVVRRCKHLEERLVERVRELSDESDRVQRLEDQAESAKARLRAMENQNEALARKLQSPRSLQSSAPKACPPQRRFVQPDIRPSNQEPSPRRHSFPRVAAVAAAQAALQEPRGDMSARLPGPAHRDIISPDASGATLEAGSESARRRGTAGNSADAMRFLCEFVEKEEARLGLGLSPPRPPPSGAPQSSLTTLR